jgi:peptidoglycan/xylan/chitin deacetylase (PgdA/CDA1 family)
VGHRRAQLKRVLLAATRPLARPTRRHRRVVGLCYHSVHDDKPFATVDPDSFRRHLDWLVEHCDVGPMDLHAAFDSFDGARPLVLLTFDDGYDDNHTVVLPILEEYGLRATFFLTTGFLDRDPQTVARFVRERAAPEAMLGSMSWSQVRELQAAGMTIGAHSRTHRNLAGLEPAAVREELRTSRATLEERLGVPIRSMAFPYGKPRVHFTSDETVPEVRGAGYELAAAATARGIRPGDQPLEVPRFFVARDDVATLREKVLGRWDALGWWQEHSPLRVQRMVSPADFTH